MQHQLVPVAAALSAEVFGPLEGGERVMWRGRAGVAEYAFDRAASLPRWTLPETTEVLVTDRRVIYAYVPEGGDQVITSGELRWLWPQHLRLQPGARTAERGPAASQIQLVCGASDGSFPALVFAGGDLRTVADADRLANVLRQAIARFRVDNATPLGLSAGQARMLSRLLIGPEFINHQGGDGQTVSLLGAMLLQRPASTSAAPPQPPAESPAAQTPAAETLAAQTPAAGAPRAEGSATDWPAPGPPPAESPAAEAETAADKRERPGIDADVSRAWAAARAEQATQKEQPALAERAADLAARIANLIALQGEPAQGEPAQGEPAQGQQAQGQQAQGQQAQGQQAQGQQAQGQPTSTKADPGTQVTEELDASRFEVPTTNLAERAEALRRSAARLAANSAGSRVAGRRPDVTTPNRT